MNHYRTPGLEATPYAPLCPHLNNDHDKFYVPVDDTDQEFRRFQTKMNSVRWLIEKGRLVVVTGKQGCGKTSLINRCAAWLRDKLAQEDLIGEIFTLTDVATLNQAITLRMEQVLTHLVDHLRDDQHGVLAQHITELENKIRDIEDMRDTRDRDDRHAAKVDRVYKHLNDALPNGRIAIILLPPSSDLVHEITNYVNFAKHPRITFFAETDCVDAAHRMWQTNHTNERIPPILLKVGPLNPGDGWVYAQTRQGTAPADMIFPTVSEETMRRVTSEGEISIGRLHKLLYGVYDRLASHGTPGGPLSSHEVSYEHIANYALQVALSEPGHT